MENCKTCKKPIEGYRKDDIDMPSYKHFGFCSEECDAEWCSNMQCLTCYKHIEHDKRKYIDLADLPLYVQSEFCSPECSDKWAEEKRRTNAEEESIWREEQKDIDNRKPFCRMCRQWFSIDGVVLPERETFCSEKCQEVWNKLETLGCSCKLNPKDERCCAWHCNCAHNGLSESGGDDWRMVWCRECHHDLSERYTDEELDEMLGKQPWWASAKEASEPAFL